MNILEVGCGKDKNPEAIGLDSNPNSDADVIHDLNVFPYPFENNSFDVIIADSVIEHLDNIIMVMEELHRICISDGVIRITVPFFGSWTAFTDPTHRHYFGIHSFDYFIKGKDLFRYHYSNIQYEMKLTRYLKGISGRLWFIDKFTLWFANRYKYIYETRLAFIIPVEDIYFELIVKK